MHVGIAYLRWRGKRSRHSRRICKFAYLIRGPCIEVCYDDSSFVCLLHYLPVFYNSRPCRLCSLLIQCYLENCNGNENAFAKPECVETLGTYHGRKNLTDQCALPICPGSFDSDCKDMIIKLIIEECSLGTRSETVLKWMPVNVGNEQTLVWVMLWCRQVDSHYKAPVIAFMFFLMLAWTSCLTKQ